MSPHWTDRIPTVDGQAMQGTGSFRMMPIDEYASAPASGTVTSAAGGNALVLTYTWVHPDDGQQEGVLLVGSPADEDPTVTAAWLDGWHQKPGPMVLSGRQDGAVTRLEATYAQTWGWQIDLDLSNASEVRILMRNVVPEEALALAPPGTDAQAGPYDVMDLRLTRASE